MMMWEMSLLPTFQGRYLGVCCPEAVTPAPTTQATTQATTGATAAPSRACGVNAKRFSTRIVGGKPADPDEWPWLAALVHKDGQGSGEKQLSKCF